MYRGMLGLNGAGFSDALLWQVTPDQWWCLGLAGLLVYAPPLLRGRLPDGAVALAWWGGPLLGFLVAMVALYSRAAVPFLYFQF